MFATRVKIDSSGYKRALGVLASGTKRGLKAALETEAKQVIKAIIQVTPPNTGSMTQAKARKKGEENVKRDIYSIMRSGRGKKVRSDLASIHAAARTEQGVNAPSDPKERIPVPAAMLKSYVKKMQAKVGILASGWAKAARKFGYEPPQWISRHKPQGSGDIKLTRNSITLVLHNAVDYSNNLERRIRRALGMRVRAIVNRAAKQAADKAKKDAGL